MKCGRCGHEAADVVCDGCGAPLPPDPSVDHFTRLGLPRRFHLDPAELTARHRERLRRAHPDRHVGAAPAVRNFALEQATALNDALRTLADPLSRAEYLLGLHDAPRRAAADEAAVLEPAFRMELVEFEQAFEELEALDGREERDRIAREVATRYEAGLAAIGEALDGDVVAGEVDALAVEAARLRRLRALLQRWNRGAA